MRSKKDIRKKRLHKPIHFDIYRDSINKFFSFMKKHNIKFDGINFSTPFEQKFSFVYNYGMSHLPDFALSPDAHIMMSEYLWNRSGRTTYFIEDSHLAKMSFNAKFDIDDYTVPNKIFSFSFPSDLELEGVKIGPCLFGEIEVPLYRELFKKKTEEISGREIFFHKDISFGDYDGSGIYIIFPFGKEYVRVWFPKYLTKDILKENFMEEHLDYKGRMNSEEYNISRIYLRLCISVCIYMSVFPESIKEGLPFNSTFDFDPIGINKKIVLKKEHASPSAHIRRWHFRCLRDEKFRRDENGNPRIVFVNAAIIGGKIDAYSLERPTRLELATSDLEGRRSTH